MKYILGILIVIATGLSCIVGHFQYKRSRCTQLMAYEAFMIISVRPEDFVTKRYILGPIRATRAKICNELLDTYEFMDDPILDY